MPDYTLPRNTPQVPKQPISPQPQTQSPPQQVPSAVAQLSAASQQLKMETENALLREALATSAQNCEALMKQLAESQAEFQRQAMDAIKLSQKAYMGVHHDLKTGLEKAYSLIERNNQSQLQQINQYNQSHQNQLSKLAGMNESFSRNLSDVLTLTTDRLIAKVAADTQIALEANAEAMTAIIKAMETASAGVTDNVEKFNTNLTEKYKKSKTVLDNRSKAYHESMQHLFKVDGWRQVAFWLGIGGGILTPIVLIIGHFL